MLQNGQCEIWDSDSRISVSSKIYLVGDIPWESNQEGGDNIEIIFSDIPIRTGSVSGAEPYTCRCFDIKNICLEIPSIVVINKSFISLVLDGEWSILINHGM